MARKHNKRYVCDFETSTPEFYEKDGIARVWAWAKVNIDDLDDFEYDNNIESLFDWFENVSENISCFYHNLKFDGQYLLWYMEHHNYKWIQVKPDEKKKRPPFTYSTVITDVGQWYQIQIYYQDHTVTIKDSMKIYNMSEKDIAASLGLPEQKLELDYSTYRAVGHVLTPHEVEYIKHDVIIVARALKTLFDQGHTKLTIGSNALADFKKRCKNFKDLFPVLDGSIDASIRQSYKGGFTYLNPKHANKHFRKKGVVFDYNSLYPSILYNEVLPFGLPLEFEGEYQKNEDYPLYIQFITCSFDLKKNKIPSIQLKHSMSFMPNEYIESSHGQRITLSLCNPDYELFKEQYNIYDPIYDGGFMFHGQTGMFKEFIDYWSNQKIQAKKDGNRTWYLCTKLFMNSTYGKMGSNPNGGMKQPVLNSDDLISYPSYKDERKSIYVPIATFTTAYGRKRIIEASQFIRDWSTQHKGFDAYIYSDTDSIHAFLNDSDIKELSKYLDIDDYKLGALKKESEFTESKYIRQKCYMEKMIDGNLNVTIAGLPKKLAPLMSFKTFKIGFKVSDLPKKYLDQIGYKLTYKQVKGGVLLVNTDFTIK